MAALSDDARTMSRKAQVRQMLAMRAQPRRDPRAGLRRRINVLIAVRRAERDASA